MKPDINSNGFKGAITVEQMRKSDAYTIKNFVSGKELMYRAAMGIYDSFKWKDKKIAIITGSGNNGGDGYALAGILAQNEIIPTLIRTSEKFSDDGRYYFDIARGYNVPHIMYDNKTDLNQYDVIVDCMLGTGFKGTPRGVIADAINKINNSNCFVICADINSGIDGDTGEITLAVKSDLTVSIGFYKKGMFLGDAPKYIKELINVDIGIMMVPYNF